MMTFFSKRELTFTFAIMSSSVRPPVCLSSVTFVRLTQPVEIFGNVSMPFATLADIQVKFYGDRPRETHPSGRGVLNASGVAEYRDF